MTGTSIDWAIRFERSLSKVTAWTSKSHPAVYELHIDDVVLYKLLPTVSIELLEGIKLRVIEFLLTEFYISNVIQTIRFLVRISKFLIQIKIV